MNLSIQKGTKGIYLDFPLPDEVVSLGVEGIMLIKNPNGIITPQVFNISDVFERGETMEAILSVKPTITFDDLGMYTIWITVPNGDDMEYVSYPVYISVNQG